MSVDDRLRIEGLEEQVALLREALTTRDGELQDLQEKLRAWTAADQRSSGNESADHWSAIVAEKDQVIRDLQLQLKARGDQGNAETPSRSTPVATPEPHADAGELKEARERLAQAEQQVQTLSAEHDALRASLDAASEENARLQGELQACTNELTAARCEAAAQLRAEAEFEDLNAQLLRARGKVVELEKAAANAVEPPGVEKEKEVAALTTALKEKEQQGLQLAAAVEQLSEALETKTKQLTSANRALDEVGAGGAGAAQERLRVRLEASSRQCQTAQAEAKEARQQAEDLSKKVQRLESQLLHARAEQEEALARASKPAGVEHAAVFGGVNGQAGGRIGAAISSVLEDVEMGDKAGVTLTDLGCSTSSRCLGPLDRSLQRFSAMMTVRADARLAGFGVWALCHALYVATCAYIFLLR